MRLLSALAAFFALTRVARGLTSDLAPVTAFVSPSPDVAMYIYVPQTTTDKPAIVVAIHSCERTAGYYFDNTGYASLADVHGYIVIYPNSSAISECWDTSSPQSLTHNGGGHSQAIANMVTYAVKNYNADPTRVAVTGSSSGGIMVNLLAGIYPEIFQAASVFSGTYAGSIWPYSGSRPKMMIWHGTIDEKYLYPLFGVELAGWSSVLGVSFSQNITDTPSPGYTKMVYGDGTKLIGISAAGVGHTVPVDAATDLAWFCIFPECDLGVSSAPSSSSSSSSTSSTSSSSSTTSTSSTTSEASSTTSSTSSTSSETSTETISTSDGSTLTSAAASSTSSTGTTTSNVLAGETSSSTAAPIVASAHTGLSSGAKAGISVGSIGAALFLLAAALFLIRKRRTERSLEPEPENAVMSSEPEGHQTHSGYGAVPFHDAAQTRDNAEKQQGLAYPEPTSRAELLSHVPGYHDRDSTASTLLPPPSPREDQRFSATSTTMLLPHSPKEYQRQSAQTMSEIPLHAYNEEMSDISLNADRFRNGAEP